MSDLGVAHSQLQTMVRRRPRREGRDRRDPLAAVIPTPILADICGLGTNTAVRWATLASRDWSHYTANGTWPSHRSPGTAGSSNSGLCNTLATSAGRRSVGEKPPAIWKSPLEPI